MSKWSEWRPFPDPKKQEYLHAPFGAGVYELRHKSTRELVLYGSSRNVAYRMTSLLPALRGGRGKRDNDEKRDYVYKHLEDIEYQTLACRTPEKAKKEESQLRMNKAKYIFPR